MAWQLLRLFLGLFGVNQAFETTGLAAPAVVLAAAQGVHLSEPGPLPVGVAQSNRVSDVPAGMLLSPHLGTDPRQAGGGPDALDPIRAQRSAHAGRPHNP